MRTLRQLRADNGPLGPYGCGHFTAAESAALLTIAEAAQAWNNSVLPGDDPMYGDLNLYDTLATALGAYSSHV